MNPYFKEIKELLTAPLKGAKAIYDGTVKSSYMDNVGPDNTYICTSSFLYLLQLIKFLLFFYLLHYEFWNPNLMAERVGFRNKGFSWWVSCPSASITQSMYDSVLHSIAIRTRSALLHPAWRQPEEAVIFEIKPILLEKAEMNYEAYLAEEKRLSWLRNKWEERK